MINRHLIAENLQDDLDREYKGLFVVEYDNDSYTLTIKYSFFDSPICEIDIEFAFTERIPLSKLPSSFTKAVEYADKIKDSLSNVNYRFKEVRTPLIAGYSTSYLEDSDEFLLNRDMLESVGAKIMSLILGLLVHDKELCVQLLEHGFRLERVKGFIKYDDTTYAVLTPGWGEVLSDRLYEVIDCETFTYAPSTVFEKVVAKYNMFRN